MINSKEDWEKIKTQELIPIEVWFGYYRESGGYLKDIHEFARIFNEIMTMVPVFRTVTKRVTPEIAKKRLYDYYDNKIW